MCPWENLSKKIRQFPDTSEIRCYLSEQEPLWVVWGAVSTEKEQENISILKQRKPEVGGENLTAVVKFSLT